MCEVIEALGSTFVAETETRRGGIWWKFEIQVDGEARDVRVHEADLEEFIETGSLDLVTWI